MIASRRPAVLGTALISMALLATGCTSDGGDASEESLLQPYFEAMYGGDLSPEEQERYFAEQQTKIEEAVAACMTKEGFEYVPSTTSGGMVVVSDDGEWDPESKEWVEQYGYGLFTYPGQQDGDEEPVIDESVDPNQAYVESLSPSEQEAYYEVLHGPMPSDEEINEDGSYEYNWEDAGCYGAAQHEIMGEQLWESEEFAPLLEAMNSLYEGVQTHPDTVALDAEWASCMADKGRGEFTRQSDPIDALIEQSNEIYGDGTGEIDEEAVAKAEAELQEKEIEVALVDLECRQQTDYASKSASIYRKIEEQFIADHKAELDAFKAAAEQRRAE